MAIALYGDMEEGSSGTTIAAAVGGPVEDAWDSVTIGTGATLQYSNTQAAHGVISALVATSGTAATSYMTWSTSMGSLTTQYGRQYIYLTANPTTQASILRQGNGATFCGALQVTTTGHFQAVDSSFGAVWTSAAAIPLNTWIRIEWQWVASTTVGQIIISYYLGDSQTSVETFMSAANQNFGAASFANTDFGWVTSAANLPSLYIDDVAVTTVGLFGPATILFEPDQSVVGQFDPFPDNVNGIIVMILLNNTWIDITNFVLQESDISISGRGRPNESQQINPVSMTLKINNSGGNFTPNNPNSPFYPFLTKNTQIRVYLNVESSTGNVYQGFRFWGEVRKWPPSWDVTGNFVWVNVTAGGILTRYVQGKNIGSTLRRYYGLLISNNSQNAPFAYWSCEELQGGTQFNSGISGGSAMTWTGTPTLSSDNSCPGSDPLPLFNKSVWTGNTGTYSFNGPSVFTKPGLNWWVCPGGVTVLSSVQTGGAGGGGASGTSQAGGFAGGGGEFAQNVNVGVTPGLLYGVFVGRGGHGAPFNKQPHRGRDGQPSHFVGDNTFTIANGGKGGRIYSAGPGGSGSTATTHFNGGSGGNGSAYNVGTSGAGGGGGSGGGTAANGNAGSNASGLTGGAGATPPTGGGKGGDGGNARAGNASPIIALAKQANTGGGGGGGGCVFSPVLPGPQTPAMFGPGYPGGAGGVTLNFTTSTSPNDTTISWVMNVPNNGMPDGASIARGMCSGGTLGGGGYMEAYYKRSGGGTLCFRGITNGSVTEFDTSTANGVSGINGIGAIMCFIQIVTNGASVECNVWIYSMASNGSINVTNGTGTSFTGSISAVTSIVMNANGTIQDTAAGQVALIYSQNVGLSQNVLGMPASPFNGYNSELAGLRFARVCAENNIAAKISADQNWDFEDGTTQGWTPVTGTGSVANSNAWASIGQRCLSVTSVTSATGFGATSPVFTIPTGFTALPIGVVADIHSSNTGSYPTLKVSAMFTFLTSGGATVTTFLTNQTTFLARSATDVQTVFCSTSPLAISGISNTIAKVQVSIIVNNSVGSGLNLSIDNVAVVYGGAMGPQPDDKLINILQQVENVDQGLIIEPRDFFGLRYRTRTTLQNQAAGLTLDYSLSQIAAGIQPVFDESLVRNSVTATKRNGSTVNRQLTSGALSVQLPPNGIGEYPYTLIGNFYSDSQVVNACVWALTVGTVNDFRYTDIPLDMTRPEMASLFTSAGNLDDGDLVSIINAPSFLPSSSISQLAYSLDEKFNAYKWSIDVTGVPASEYSGSGFPVW